MKHPADFEAEARAKVRQMSVTEKAALMSGSGFWHLQPLPQYGLAKVMVADGPHGLRKQGGDVDNMGLQTSVPATCFPPAVTLASTWNRALLAEVGAAIGRECQKENVSVVLGPGVNIKRSPLCGRNFEYYSEDPYLAGELATQFINGVQGTGIGTSLKHFAANNQEAQRMVVDTLVDRRALFEIYLPAFETAVTRAQPWTLMCAYNRLNGSYCSEHEELLSDILRDRWGFKGLVMTDWGAVNDRPRGIAAGLELEMPSSGGMNDALAVAAVNAGRLSMAVLERAACRVAALNLAAQKLAAPVEVDFDAHHALARRAAGEGAVLLKNEGDILPLQKTGTLAVIGAFAATPRFQGAGSSQVNATQTDKPLDAFRAVLGAENVFYAAGFEAEHAKRDIALIDEAVATASKADQAVLMVGLPPLFEAEGFDRTHLHMPEQLDALVKAVLAANPKTVIVLSNGAPIAMPWVDAAAAILELYLAGQAGAGALVDLLFGEIAPSGKLAETFPLVLADMPVQENFANHKRQIIYREGLNVGYRYFVSHDKPVLFSFGHGLSYTQFSYSDVSVAGDFAGRDTHIEVRLTVQNTGRRAGAEIVQLYVRDVESTAYRPDRELKGFEKVHLQSGESQQVSMVLDWRAFAYFDVTLDDWDVEPGEFEILLGASSTDIRETIRIAVPDDGRNQTRLHETPYVVMGDAQLTALGLRLSAPEAIKPYHANTTLADIRHKWLGRRLIALVFKMARATLSPTTGSPVQRKMREEMLLSMRLSTVRNMSQGALTPKRFDLLLHALNHQWIGFIVRLLRA